MIECGELDDLQTLCGGHDRGVHGPKGKVSIGCHEFGDPDPVTRVDRLRDEVPRCQVSQETHLGLGAKSRFEKVRDFGHH